MSLNAVEQYVKNLITGYKSPLDDSPITVWHLPPVLDNFTDSATVYVWGTTLEEQRMTAPRSTNYTGKIVEHSIVLSLKAMYAPYDPSQSTDPMYSQKVDQGFAVLIDGLQKILRGQSESHPSVLSIPITDPVTGETSYIIDIGERFTVHQAYPELASDGSFYIREADIVCPVVEQVTG